MKALRRFTEHAPMAPEGVLALSPDHEATSRGRTLFPTTVVAALESPRLLVSGANQRKLGDRVVKGAWAGFPIFSLTLEERATCPRSCRRWLDCMGNGMHLSRRHRPGLDLENLLWVELDALAARHPGGFVVRLHVLGDFYAVRYADLWAQALATIPALHLFGYTARNPDMGIGHLIAAMNERFPDRCAIRFSTAAPGPMRAVTIDRVPESRRLPEGIVCPAQTGATECCGTCGLCWAEAAKGQTIVFVLHGRKPRGPKKVAKPALVEVTALPAAPPGGPISPIPAPDVPTPPAKPQESSAAGWTNFAQPEVADIRLGEALNAAILAQGGSPRGAKEPKGCRWISGDVRSGDWRYCQQPASSVGGHGPYCPEHAAKAGKLYTGGRGR